MSETSEHPARVLSIADVAARLGVSKRAVEKWCARAAKACPHDRNKMGGEIRIALNFDEVLTWCDRAGLPHAAAWRGRGRDERGATSDETGAEAGDEVRAFSTAAEQRAKQKRAASLDRLVGHSVEPGTGLDLFEASDESERISEDDLDDRISRLMNRTTAWMQQRKAVSAPEASALGRTLGELDRISRQRSVWRREEAVARGELVSKGTAQAAMGKAAAAYRAAAESLAGRFGGELASIVAPEIAAIQSGTLTGEDWRRLAIAAIERAAAGVLDEAKAVLIEAAKQQGGA